MPVMVRYQILGQSNFAIAVLLDTLRRTHRGRIAVEIVSNIPPEENPSLAHAYAVDGVETREVSHDRFERDPRARLLVGSIGRAREPIFEFFRDRFAIGAESYSSTIDPRANLALRVVVGRGVHISPGATIAPHSELGDFVVVNRNASVGHHTVLASFVTLNPGVHVAGVCRVERGVTIGVGASVVDGVTIGAGAVIGAGSVVTKSIPPNVVAYGVPARVIRQR
jgi:sugar O-acyltransferase (sialic acid O-acetyltransferase NeuD family)